MSAEKATPRVTKVARKGIRSFGDVATVFSALMADVVSGRVSPAKANKFSAEIGRVMAGKKRRAMSEALTVHAARPRMKSVSE